jgi:predicted PhzF superfamily epimerase YddE/YHI9
VRHSLVSPEQARSILNLQGVKLGRPSWIHVSIDTVDPSTALGAGPSTPLGADSISRVRVGGTSVFVAEGTMEVED